MNTLRLWIDGNFPDRHSACHWWLYDEAGLLLQQGNSEPRHWPGAHREDAGQSAQPAPNCEILLSADQASGVITALPGKRAAQSAEVMRYAVEDRLVADVQTYHLVRGNSLGNDRYEVIAIDTRRIDVILASLRQVGLTPVRMVVAAQAFAADDGNWPLLLAPAGGSLSTPTGWLILDDAIGEHQPPAELVWAAETGALSPATALRPLLIGDARISATHWSAKLGKPITGITVLDAALACRNGVNLLQGAYAPRRELTANWRSLLPLARFAAVALAIAAVSLLGEWAWLRHQQSSLREAQVAIVKQALPTLPIVVAPMLQMQRALDTARHAQGQLSDSDFLPLLAAVADELGVPVEELHYRDGRLEVKLDLPDMTALENLKLTLRNKGYALTVAAVNPSASAVRAVLLISRGELS